MQMDWSVAQGHEDTTELLVLRELFFLLPPTPMSDGKPEHSSVREARDLIMQLQADIHHNIGNSGPEHELSELVIWKVVYACYNAGFNILNILLAIDSILCSATFYPELVSFTASLTNSLMDICITKEQAKAIIAPFEDQPRTPYYPEDPMLFALRKKNKAFIGHPQVSMLANDFLLETVWYKYIVGRYFV